MIVLASYVLKFVRHGDKMGKDIKILIVEDNIELVKILNMQLTGEGFDVAYAEDGVQAVSTAQEQRPNLILLDLGLPGGDGFVVMERLSKLNTTKLIPIIIMTGEDKQHAKQQAIDAGAAGYLVKPIEFSVLLEQINKTLGLKTDNAPAPAPEPEAAPEPEPTPVPAPEAAKPAQPEPAQQEQPTKAPEKVSAKPSASGGWKDLIKKY